MNKLEGKVGIVTGASRGVGKYIALELAKEGCNLVIAARTTATGQSMFEGTITQTAKEIEKIGVKALPLRCDVTDDESIDEMVNQTIKEMGRIDILINNAGIMAPARLVDMPLKRWDLLWKVNVRGAIACSKAVLPYMIEKQNGVIINISSIAVDMDSSGNISYMLTKHALRSLSKGLAEEEKIHNIRVFSLSPYGVVPTPGTMSHRDGEEDFGSFLERPEAMGQAVIYLCREKAKELSGQHFYSRQLLKDLVNNGVDLYQGDKSLLEPFKRKNQRL